MKIHITQEHINLGERGSCTSDPLALALTTAGYIGVWVSPTSVHFTDKEFGYRHEVPLSPEVLDFIKAFDNGEIVLPFTFEMEE